MNNYNPLYLPLSLSNQHLDGFDPLCLFVLSVATCIILYSIFYRREFFFRPAFIFSLLVCIFYLVPLALFSEIFNSALSNFFDFARTVQIAVLFGLLWPMLTPNYSLSKVKNSEMSDSISPLFFWGMFCICFGLVFIYLIYVHPSCTGLYALILDPEMSLLAREFSIKLSGSTMASRSYGVLANVVVPTLFVLTILKIKTNLLVYKPMHIVCWIFAALILFGIVLLPGIKGMMIPTIIVTVAALTLLAESFFQKILGLALSMSVFFIALSSFGLVADRFSAGGGSYGYDAGFCAASGNSCTESIVLVDSLYQRVKSLGLSNAKRDLVRKQINQACHILVSERTSTTSPSAYAHLLPSPFSDHDNSSPSIHKKIKFQEHLEKYTFSDYLHAVLYRAFVIPLQVAGWYYLYITEYENPGFHALPFSRYLYDDFFNAPMSIYQAYGSMYSGGDRTSTSTAPTSFIFLYSVFLGRWGLVLSLFCLAVFDICSSIIIRYLNGVPRVIFIGIIGVVCFNMLVSDFLTVLFSHGAVAAFICFPVLAWADKSAASKTGVPADLIPI